MRELKPCPFCGSTVVIQKIEPRLYRPTRNHPYSVVCYNCDLIFGYDIDYGGIFDTEEEAAEAWNKRSGEQERKKGEWIPCSEKLPVDDDEMEDDEVVLVSDGIDYAVAFWRSDAEAWDDPLHGWLDSFEFDVKAWMPLPEPYKEEGEKHEGSD